MTYIRYCNFFKNVNAYFVTCLWELHIIPRFKFRTHAPNMRHLMPFSTFSHTYIWVVQMRVCNLCPFLACVGIMWDVPNAPQVNTQDLQKPIQNQLHQKGLSQFRFSFYEQLKVIPFCMDLYVNLNNHLLVIPLLSQMHIM